MNVRVLLDQNLSPKLIAKLADVLPGLESVYEHGLTGASDPLLFEWARASAFSGLITADRDFVKLVERLGPPPRVIRIEHCDYPAKIIEQMLRREAMRINAFLESGRPLLLLRLSVNRPGAE